MEDRPAEIVLIYASRSRRRCDENALVLRAMGIASRILPADGAFALLVEAGDAGRAREQLRLYGQERRAGQPRVDARLRVHDGLVCASLYGLTILLFDMLERGGAFGLDWWQAGMSQAGRVVAGEWWRVLTALTLHGDTIHLTGNLVFGLIFGFFVGGTLGWGLGWAGMLLAGALGNLLNAFLQAPGHNSIGASTAVFAAVGILAAHAWKRRGPRINRWAPLGGGVALLAFIGMGGERTDVLAHLTGLGAGCLFGLAFAALEARAPLAAWHKHSLGLAATLLLALAWTLALMAHG
jgi:membrane associated rhomboid family serine protease